MSTTNEISGRYVEMPADFYTPELSRMNRQSASNKQGSDPELIEHAEPVRADMMFVHKQARDAYEDYLEAGLAKELARIHLPLAQYTEFVWKIDLHNLMHFLKLRLDGHAQWEIRQYGEALATLVKAVVPLAYEAFEDYHLDAISLSKPTIQQLQDLLTEDQRAALESRLLEQGVSPREVREILATLGGAA